MALRRIFSFDPGFVELRRASVTMVATLLSFACASVLRATFHLGVSLSILAVVLSMTLARSKPTDFKHTMIELVELMFVTVAASWIGRLFIDHANVADSFFVATMALAIYLRRFGSTFVRVGTVVSLPFIATLVAPVPVPPGAHFAYWAAPVGFIAFFWVNATRAVAAKAGYIPEPMVEHPSAKRAVSSPNRRVSASTSMALQMAVALAVAFVLGRLIYGVHWPWLVLTAYIVTSGNRGRADVLYKGVMRVCGALAGTVLATFISGLFGRGDKWAIVILFVVIAVAGWLRSANYAYWAGAVTASLSLLYGYFGESGVHRLDERLGGVLVGGVIAVAASWFVLPVKTKDVLRKRMAEVLWALSDVIDGVKTGASDLAVRYERLRITVDMLLQIRRPLDAWHRIGRGRGHHGTSAIKVQALKDCRDEARSMVDEVRTDQSNDAASVELCELIASNVKRIRLALRDQVGTELRPTPPLTSDETGLALRLRRINDLLSVFGA
jgi:gas vesicle protein